MNFEMSNGIIRAESLPAYSVGIAEQLESDATPFSQNTATDPETSENSTTNFHSNYIKISAPQSATEETVIVPEIVAPSTLTPTEPNTNPYDRGVHFLSNSPSLTPSASYYRRDDAPTPVAINQEPDAASVMENKLGPVIMRPPAIAQPDLNLATDSFPRPMLSGAVQEDMKFTQTPNEVSQKLPAAINSIHSELSVDSSIEYKLSSTTMCPPPIAQPDLILATDSSPGSMLSGATQEHVKFTQTPNEVSQKLPGAINPIHSELSVDGNIEYKLSPTTMRLPPIAQPDFIPATGSSPQTILASAPHEQRKSIEIPNATLQNLQSDIAPVISEASVDSQAMPEENPLKTNKAKATRNTQDLEVLESNSVKTEEKHTSKLESPLIKDTSITFSATKDLQTPLSNSMSEKALTVPVVSSTRLDPGIKLTPATQILTSLPHTHPAVQAVAQGLVRTQETHKGISIRLDPPEMGRVFIDFQFDADKNVTAIIRSELSDTSQLLRGKSDFFQQILKESGFESVNLSFEQNENQTDQDFDSDKDRPARLFGMTEELEAFSEAKTVHTSINPKTLDISRIDIKL